MKIGNNILVQEVLNIKLFTGGTFRIPLKKAIYMQGKNIMSKIYSIRSWMESNAVQQFEQVLNIPGIITGAGMPDMHLGKYGPNGSTFLGDRVFPVLAGNDIGCGYRMCVLDTCLRTDKLIKKLNDFSSVESSLTTDTYQDVFGTIGGGNHFLEFQQVHEVADEKLFKEFKLDHKATYAMIHTGSRGLGESILQETIQAHNASGLVDRDAFHYMEKHNMAMEWAKGNRHAILDKVSQICKTDINTLFDVPHNFIEQTDNGFIHRKGSSASDRGLIIIPGSRGDFSVLVKPITSSESLHSIAHGAGRKINRTDAKYKITPGKNKMGNHVICGDKQLIMEEDPSCYKNVSHVVHDLVESGLIEIVAWMKPIVTFKTEETNKDKKENKKLRDMERKQARKNKWSQR